ncbi:MAG TPA: hypothetical protein VKG78_02860 [Opitutaceae bacterium]|nr:hypothetical protein [Opitutaceae bacterium]
MKAPEDEETTGLPGLRTWRRVYLAVVVVFAVWVGLLTALARMFP